MAAASTSTGWTRLGRLEPRTAPRNRQPLLPGAGPGAALSLCDPSDLDEVSAYAIDKQTGRITALNRQSCGGKNPVHLSIDPTGRWIITANYAAGSVGVVPIEKDGTLGPRADLVTQQGEPGPDRVRQASSHPHEAVFDPAADFSPCPIWG